MIITFETRLFAVSPGGRIDDCNSTKELVDWLRLRQKEHGIFYLGKTEVIEAD